MKTLEFTIKDIEQLVKQGDAEYMNKDKVLVRIHQNLYRREDDCYYNVEQRIRMGLWLK